MGKDLPSINQAERPMRQKLGSESNKMKKSRSLTRNHKGALLVFLSLWSLSASTSVLAGAVFVGEPVNHKGVPSAATPALQINSNGVEVTPYPMEHYKVETGFSKPAPAPTKSMQYSANPPKPTVSPKTVQQHTRTDATHVPTPSIDHMQLTPRNPNSLHITNVNGESANANVTIRDNRVNNNHSKRQPPPEPVKYQVPAGWLSEGMRGLAQKAGYSTLVWSLDEAGRKDFRVHAPLSLKGEEYLELLYDLSKPYPVRLCLYATDKVAKVVMEGESCLVKGEVK